MSGLSAKVVKTSSGAQFPTIGLGTFEPGSGGDGRCARAVREGRKQDIIISIPELCTDAKKRSEKANDSRVIWQQYHHPEDVVKSLEESPGAHEAQLRWELYLACLRDLESSTQTNPPVVDLYLMHCPLAFKRTENYEILTGPDGKVRVKNFDKLWGTSQFAGDS
ncbi:hypothetical protein CONLIGDRAFT_639504 [Coniochaeta ligniaria NRRL 30616]|uniref:Aldo/keto reductase n=1 Tax=Coniochaeta ligniaria NRRL 30616 TaxID=1408157 RepID=A0A1J7K0G5_9PEZI|nr:hypothetical protein CONLIGDRAFT_639504 [Coniochaeta ligniaria NRRL 30616]